MIKTIFFDLDNTLWDHNKAQKYSIEKIYFQLKEFYPSLNNKNDFIKIYDKCNNEVWDEYKKGKLSHHEVRVNRFINLLCHYNIKDKDLAIKLNNLYISIYPTWSFLIDGAKELLEKLYPTYSLGIITNGFSETQNIKLKNSNLKPYFKWIVYSGEIGKPKPHPEIFEYAIKKANIFPKEALFIGDDFTADIIGAKSIGMHTIWFNPKKIKETEKNKYADYEIYSLEEVWNIVKSLETC
ncbi:YjjG family noncanonical pyrimidine nucleotidase [Defluviitalea phaphyphila]|uniref:YjjG family noncanonical pyrimidine nucleotidase n=1 Tax=Defluviitalea phaphyphila TaxID=1473580 RepID=UPI000731DE55|nr:YjjG family noncanonical pyrimidine nucleotidase [Defluviitalea phaphyphila]